MACSTRVIRVLRTRAMMLRRSGLTSLLCLLICGSVVIYIMLASTHLKQLDSLRRSKDDQNMPVHAEGNLKAAFKFMPGPVARGKDVADVPAATVGPQPTVRPARKHEGPALTFSADGEQFLLRGKPLRILSGELHYFRVVPQYWEDRLRRLKAGGLNTVSTYVAWNMHEPHPGKFDFTPGTRANLAEFVRIAHRLGLYVIIRPGPYICAEWEFGGLPGWLLRSNGNQIRTSGKWFLESVDRYLAAVFKQTRYLQHGYGGPIIAVQIENEYGTFGDSRSYLEALKRAAENGGITELLYKCDDHNGLPKGLVQLPGVLQAVNGNDRVSWHIKELRKNQLTKAPIFVAELWTGWFTLFGGDFRTKTPNEIALAAKTWLERGASINFYMWHGGSNFYHNGAVNVPPFSIMTSSYDYDSPVSENGTLMPKFYTLRNQLKETLGADKVVFGEIPPPIPVQAYGPIKITSYATLDDVIAFASKAVHLEQVCSMEELPINDNTGQVMGFTLYRHRGIKASARGQQLVIGGLADYGAVLMNGVLLGHVNLQFDSGSGYFQIKPDIVSTKENILDILVGSTGRNNYLPDGSEKKGLLWPVQLGAERLSTWEAYPLEFDKKFISLLDSHTARFRSISGNMPAGPVLLRAEFAIARTPSDTFLRLDGFVRGLVVVNGEVLGRYWDVGPQKTLYVPAPLLRLGPNVVLLMEMNKVPLSPVITFVDRPDLGR